MWLLVQCFCASRWVWTLPMDVESFGACIISLQNIKSPLEELTPYHPPATLSKSCTSVLSMICENATKRISRQVRDHNEKRILEILFLIHKWVQSHGLGHRSCVVLLLWYVLGGGFKRFCGVFLWFRNFIVQHFVFRKWWTTLGFSNFQEHPEETRVNVKALMVSCTH